MGSEETKGIFSGNRNGDNTVFFRSKQAWYQPHRRAGQPRPAGENRVHSTRYTLVARTPLAATKFQVLVQAIYCRRLSPAEMVPLGNPQRFLNSKCYFIK